MAAIIPLFMAIKMPKGIFGKIDKLMTVTKKDVSESVSRHKVQVDTDGPFISAFVIFGGEPIDDAYAEVQVMSVKNFLEHVRESIVIDTEWPDEVTDRVAYLSGMELSEDLRSRGIDKQIMKKMERQAKRKAASYMALAAEKHIIGFYEGLGYSEFDDNAFLTLMRKKL